LTKASSAVIFSATVLLSAFVSADDIADRIVIEKSAHRMTLYHAGREIRTNKVSLGGEPKGAKTRQGDHRTPEGEYAIDARNAQGKYYKSLHISYPNSVDRARARKLKVNPGGDIMIHGLPNGQGYIGKAHLLHDWTDGCVAVTDEEIDEVWKLVPTGTVVEIRP
jgi:murein L,D-transpeptidase YafK